MSSAEKIAVTTADRTVLSDILNLPQELAMQVVSGQRDDHPELMRALQAVARHRQSAMSGAVEVVLELVAGWNALGDDCDPDPLMAAAEKARDFLAREGFN